MAALGEATQGQLSRYHATLRWQLLKSPQQESWRVEHFIARAVGLLLLLQRWKGLQSFQPLVEMAALGAYLTEADASGYRCAVAHLAVPWTTETLQAGRRMRVSAVVDVLRALN